MRLLWTAAHFGRAGARQWDASAKTTDRAAAGSNAPHNVPGFVIRQYNARADRLELPGSDRAFSAHPHSPPATASTSQLDL